MLFRHSFVLLATLCMSYTYGQMAHGFELGANLMSANFTIDSETIETKTAVGPRGGYVGEYNFNNHFFLRGAALFMQKGFKFENENWVINSIDIPISIGYATDIKPGKLRWFIDGGASIEFNTKATTKIDDDTIELIIGKGEGELKSTSSGIIIGTGVEFSNLLKLRVTYYSGLTNMINTSGTDEWKNQYIGLSLNFLFRKQNL